MTISGSGGVLAWYLAGPLSMRGRARVTMVGDGLEQFTRAIPGRESVDAELDNRHPQVGDHEILVVWIELAEPQADGMAAASEL